MDTYWVFGLVIVILIAVVVLFAWVESWAPPALSVALRLGLLTMIVPSLFEPLRGPVWHSIVDKLGTLVIIVIIARELYMRWGPPSVGHSSPSGGENNEARA